MARIRPAMLGYSIFSLAQSAQFNFTSGVASALGYWSLSAPTHKRRVKERGQSFIGKFSKLLWRIYEGSL